MALLLAEGRQQFDLGHAESEFGFHLFQLGLATPDLAVSVEAMSLASLIASMLAATTSLAICTSS